MTELPDLGQLSSDQKDDLIRFLFAQVQHLSVQVAQLSAQVIELQGRLGKIRCACGQRHGSQFPSDIKQAVQYSPNIQALGVYLTQGQMLPYARTRELIEQLYGLTVSQATLVGWVQQAKEALQASADRIAQGLRQASVAQADSVLRFIHDPNVPFTNNLAERAIRMSKVKHKISGCFRTMQGAESFTVIRSCLDTLRKQGHSMFSVLQHAFYGNPITPTGC